MQEICNEPRLFVDGVNSNDLIQGELGNCWLVAASCCLSVHKFLWSKVSLLPIQLHHYSYYCYAFVFLSFFLE